MSKHTTSANDSMMLSLPQLSGETGVPMPTILHLAVAHPEEIPSVGAGSQRSFPQGVIPALLRLYGEEKPQADGRAGILSLSRQRREQEEALREATERKKTGSAPVETLPEDDDLVSRLEKLEDRTQALVRELAEVVIESGEEWKGETNPL